MSSFGNDENSKELAVFAAIHQVNQQVLEDKPINEILQFICDYIVDVFTYRLAWLGLKRESGIINIRACAGPGRAYLDGLSVRWDDTPEGQGPVGEALRRGQVQTVHTSHPSFALWAERAQAHDIRSCSAFPLLAGGQTLGVLALYGQRAGGLPPNTQRLLEGFVTQASAAIRYALYQERMRLHEAALSSIPHAVTIHDAAGRIFWVNPALCQLTGYRQEEVIGRNVSLMKSDCRDIPELYDLTPGETLARRKDGSFYVEEETVAAVPSKRGDNGHFVSIKRDITERKKSEQSLRETQSRLDTLVANAPLVLFALDQDGKFTLSEGQGLKALGLAPGEIIGQSVWDLYRDSPKMLDTLGRVYAGEALTETEDIGSLCFETHYTPIRKRDGLIGGVIGISNNITERKNAELALRDSESRKSAIVETARDCIISVDHEGRVIEWNPAAERTFGCTRAEAIGQDAASLTVAPARRKLFRRRVAQALTTGTGPLLNQRLETSAMRQDGSEFMAELTTTVVQAGAQPILTAYVRDITERKWTETEQREYEERLERLAFYDALTGLPNRLLFRERFEAALKSARKAEAPLALLALDLGGLKQINDTLGHIAGDDVLREAVKRFGSALPAAAIFARLGGDEFSLVLPGADEAQAVTVAQGILESLAQPFHSEMREVFVSVSIGITVFPRDDQSMNNLVRNADLAMYEAKTLGKNKHRLYAPEMQSEVLDRMVLEYALRDAVERNELSLDYQPQIDLKTRQVVGVEALLRWRHPELGLISPARFIPIAEATELIHPISDWVLHQACRQAAAWQAEGIVFGRMAVNISARQFEQSRLADQIGELLAETGLRVESLELELTESAIMSDAQSSVIQLKRLKEMGLRIAVDDFGTGYSSLAYLKRFPIHTLKIDRAFIHDIVEDSDSAAIVSAIIALAHSLRLDVIAEGVETEAQLNFLAAYQCDHVQGYHFSQPLPEAEITALLRESALWK